MGPRLNKEMRQALQGYVASGNYQLSAILGPRSKASTIVVRMMFPLALVALADSVGFAFVILLLLVAVLSILFDAIMPIEKLRNVKQVKGVIFAR